MLPYIGNLALYLFILISLLCIVYQTNHGKRYPGLYYKLYWFLFILLGTFAYFTGDYMHYKEEISRLTDSISNPTHLEPIYVWLISFTGGNYTLWRFCVYVITFSLLIYFLRLAKQNNFYTLFWCSLFILPGIVSGRSSIAIIAYFIGIIYFMQKRYGYGIMFLFFAIIAHKSILPLLLLLPFAVVRVNKKQILFISLITFVVVVSLIKPLIQNLIAMNILKEDSFYHYLEYNGSIFGSIGSVIEFIIGVMPYNIAIISFIISLWKIKFYTHEMDLIVRLQMFTFIFVLFLLTCLFSFGYSNPMFYRYYGMIKYPLLLLMVYVYPKFTKLCLTKSSFFILLIFLFSQIYSVALSAYYQYCG